MFNYMKEVLSSVVKSRLFVLAITFILLFLVLILRLFNLQIVNGENFLKDFTLTIKRDKILESTRGLIYDRNGELLAYNELAYAVTIIDSGTYEKTDEKNKELNNTIYKMVNLIEKNGDSIINDFNIYLDNDTLKFSVEGAQLERFLADIYGHATIEKLSFNKTLGYNESTASPKQVFEYLCADSKYDIADTYSKEDALKIITVRYNMFQNRFRKYLATTIASQVSDETVAVIKENSSELEGVDIEENTIRKYADDSKYFSHIIGYTGKISVDELKSLEAEDESYSLNDIVGKSGIEQVMETDLQGEKGSETLYVDNLGKVIETAEREESSSGKNVYLTIDKNLQEAVYNLIEQKLAGVVYSKIVNQKSSAVNVGVSASKLVIPIDDVYYALINNNVIDISRFNQDNATENEKALYQTFATHLDKSLSDIDTQLTMETPIAYENLEQEMQMYSSYIVSMLTSNEILLSGSIDTTDETYLKWKAESISLKEYLQYAIAQRWIDISNITEEAEYFDSSEIYTSLLAYIKETLLIDTTFHKRIYKYLIETDSVLGKDICMVLYDQEILDGNDEEKNLLASSELSAFSFIKEKIRSLEITPAQLALDPCSGSSVITDVNTGEVLASVSYPGYDNNRLANTVDAKYYSQLSVDLSLPLYNHATQERTAPGSTFKMVTAVAGLTEGVIDTTRKIKCEGTYETIKPSPKCWIVAYNSTHGDINVRQAIQHSCNYFFYETGYRMSKKGEAYDEKTGIATLKKYAELFGLGEVSGIEISESKPHISNELPIASAIGQGTHSYTTTQLARYVTAVAKRGTCYNISILDKLTDNDGTVIEDYTPSILNEMDEVSDSTWDAIHDGMKLVVEEVDAFNDIGDSVLVAGKTGTAEISTRPNHALFVGFASTNEPDAQPEIAISTRIAYGYTSAYAAELASDIIKYRYNLIEEDELLNGEARLIRGSVIGD